MSYTVYLTIDTGAAEQPWVWDRNHTSNTAPMWRKAGFDIAAWDGKPAARVAPVAAAAIEAMEANPDEYRAMNPANGWGSYESCLEFLTAIRDACQGHPKTTLEVSR